MSDTKEAVTAHGTVDYETETCYYCDNEVVTENIVGVHIDPYERTCNGVSICDGKTVKPKAERQFCETCAETVFNYERTGEVRDHVRRMKWDGASAMFVCLTTIVILVFLLIAIGVMFG